MTGLSARRLACGTGIVGDGSVSKARTDKAPKELRILVARGRERRQESWVGLIPDLRIWIFDAFCGVALIDGGSKVLGVSQVQKGAAADSANPEPPLSLVR